MSRWIRRGSAGEAGSYRSAGAEGPLGRTVIGLHRERGHYSQAIEGHRPIPGDIPGAGLARDGRRARTSPALALLAATLLALVAVGLLRDPEGAAPRSDAASEVVERLEEVARRVELIRGHRFPEPPRTRVASAAEVRGEAAELIERRYPDAQRLADEEILKLLGLVEADLDLRELVEELFEEGVAGYYDPDEGELVIVAEGAPTRVEAEMTLAHELTHALDDAVFGLREPEQGLDDRELAYAALVEGSAMVVMSEYLARHLSAPEDIAELLGSALGAPGALATGLPRYLERQLLFPYVAGERFVRTLRVRARGGWDLVDAALGDRPPQTTREILVPALHRAGAGSRPVELGAAGALRAHGEGWRRLTAGELGHFDTEAILAEGDAAQAVAAGRAWAGGRYELWRRGALEAPGCAPPCRERDALVLGWAAGGSAGTARLAAAAISFIHAALDAEPRPDAPPGAQVAWALDGGAAALGVRGGGVALAMAPDLRLAGELAGRAAALARGRSVGYRP